MANLSDTVANVSSLCLFLIKGPGLYFVLFFFFHFPTLKAQNHQIYFIPPNESVSHLGLAVEKEFHHRLFKVLASISLTSMLIKIKQGQSVPT